MEITVTTKHMLNEVQELMRESLLSYIHILKVNRILSDPDDCEIVSRSSSQHWFYINFSYYQENTTIRAWQCYNQYTKRRLGSFMRFQTFNTLQNHKHNINND